MVRTEEKDVMVKKVPDKGYIEYSTWIYRASNQEDYKYRKRYYVTTKEQEARMLEEFIAEVNPMHYNNPIKYS